MQTLLDYIESVYPISPDAQKALLSCCTEVSFKKNAIVQPIGHTCKTLYFVKKGALRIFYFKGDIDITENLEFENAFVARAESLITGQPSKKGIQAVEDTDLIAINTEKLLALYDDHLDLERLFKKILTIVLIQTLNRLESIQFYNADTRYYNLMKSHPDLLKRVPLKYVASYLGITQVSLSRIRAKH